MAAAVRSEVSVNESVLFVAFELGKKEWKLAMTTGLACRRGCGRWPAAICGGGRAWCSGAGAIWAGGDGARDQLL